LLIVPSACGSDDVADDVENAADETEDEVEGTADCSQICSRYATCVGDIDETECIDECEDIADATEAGEQSAKDCEDCLDGMSCSEAESCWSGCPVVPIPERRRRAARCTR
jgi:hypothetical protein